MACQGLEELAVGLGWYEAAALPELPAGSWARLTALRLLPDFAVPWLKPGCLPDSWCALPALRALSLRGRWGLPYALRLSALERLEIEWLAGPLKPISTLARLTSLVVKDGQAQVGGRSGAGGQGLGSGVGDCGCAGRSTWAQLQWH